MEYSDRYLNVYKKNMYICYSMYTDIKSKTQPEGKYENTCMAAFVESV